MDYLNKILATTVWEFIPNGCTNQPGPHHIRNVETGEWIEWPMTPEQKLKKVNAQLEAEIAKFLKAKSEVERLAQLTLLYHESQRKLQMTQQTPKQEVKKTYGRALRYDGKPAIEFDDVFNNYDKVDDDYDITIDETTGEVWIASNHDKAGSILQGVIKGFLKRDQEPAPPGSEFNYVIKGKPSEESKGGTRRAMFSGAIYFENLPADVFASGQQKLKFDKQEEIKPEKKDDTKPEQNRRVEADNSVDESKFVFPSEDDLRKIKKGQLKPQAGLSRNGRKKWNDTLRQKYPNCFDTGGNWIGFGDSSDNSNANNSADTDRNVQDKGLKESKSVNVLGAMGETGMGNTITKMTDEKIRNGFMLARYFDGKGYAIVSTPAKAKNFNKSAFIVCNKERTAKFMLAGLMRNQSFSQQVDGCDVFKVTELKKKFFEDDTLYVYWITNAVTALQALGTQERDIQDIREKAGS